MEQLFHTMSITKSAIGLMYHVYNTEYRRDVKIIYAGKSICTIGQALNMTTQYSNWDECIGYYDFREGVLNGCNMGEYSKKQLVKTNHIRGISWTYNNLLYQVLASEMNDVAYKFGKFMGDESGELIKETLGNSEIYFKKGTSWKWEHTKNGEPLGPHGLWMTEDFGKKFGEKARPFVMDMCNQDKVIIPDGWVNQYTGTQMKQYWNGWWYSDKCAYAIGLFCQTIAITPTNTMVQLYEENWEDDLHNYPNNVKWKFIDNIEDVYK
jgi:hypothetical protein